VLYVEELIGPATINTMPLATMDAFRDHGKLRASLEEDLPGARQVMKTLERLDIALDEVTDKVLYDGVRVFADAMDKVLRAIAIKRASAVTSGKCDGRRPRRPAWSCPPQRSAMKR
jgi:transaldolase/glucose-6-phosphate isomerase